MEKTAYVQQINTEGNNIINYVTLSEDAIRSYEKVLSVGEEKIFLDDASENLIRDGKIHINKNYINEVEHYLNGKRFCLIKAPEGRGKTYLSRIIAYNYYHERGMKVFFLDLKDYSDVTVNSISDKLQEWHNRENGQNNYLLVIENVHVYKDLESLRELVKGWINSNGNCFWFLFNARPADVELEVFSDWEEVVELKPNLEDVIGIINLFQREVGQRTFANDEEKVLFVEKIYSDKKKAGGANLRLLKIYLETWQYHKNIQYVSDISEETIIREFRRLYLSHRSKDEIETLWYISSLFQFDTPVHEDLVRNVGNLVEVGLLRFEENRYHLPHSVDASFLYKSICRYKKMDYVDQMKSFVFRFVSDIIHSNHPKDFESDFRLLLSGLFAKKDEFKEVIYCLTKVEMAEKIMKNINPGFVLTFFRPENHENHAPSFLIDYYISNKSWLKPIILSRSPGFLSYLVGVFNEFKYIIRDIFSDPQDLDNYLNANYNYRLLYYNTLLLGLDRHEKEHQVILFNHYIKNKVHLKSLFLKLNPIKLDNLFGFFNRHLNCNIIVDVFGDPNDLYTYLNANNKNYRIIYEPDAIAAICKLGEEHRNLLKESYIKNRNSFKPYLRGLSPVKLTYVYTAFKDYLKYNIIQDIFEDPKDLDKYFKEIGDNRFHKDDVLKAIQNLGDEHKQILVKYNFFDYFFYSKGKGLRIDSGYIDYFWQNKDEVHFDVCRIINQRFYLDGVSFYLDGVSWAYLVKLVSLIKDNMKKNNSQQSVDMVNTIVSIVLGKRNSMSYATAENLSYFYHNIKSVDESIANELMQKECVIADIKRRLEAPLYTVDDLNLFGYFYHQPGCKEKLESRILNADNKQQEQINEWRKKLVERLKKRGEEKNTPGTLLDFINKMKSDV